MHTSKVTQKGQILIPLELREKYKLTTDSPVMVVEVDQHIAVIPVPADPIKNGRGSIRLSSPVAKVIEEFHREERDLEERKFVKSKRSSRKRAG